MPTSRYIFGQIPWYSFLIMTGMITALFLISKEEKRLNLKKDTYIDLALWTIPVAIFGARLYYVVFSWDLFRSRPLSILEIWNGGLAIYGGIIAGIVTVTIFSRRRKLPLGLLLDMVVPGVAIAQAIGRWGNFFNMEAYGLPITNPDFCFFPLAVEIVKDDTSVWHMATFFYESIWDFCIFQFLWKARKATRRHGDLFLFYLLTYGCGRSIIEGLRTDSLYLSFFHGRASQILAVLCVVTSSVCLLWPNRPKKSGRNTTTLLCGLGFTAVTFFVREEHVISLSLLFTLSAIWGCCLFKPGRLHGRIAFTVLPAILALRLLILSLHTTPELEASLLMIPGAFAWLFLDLMVYFPHLSVYREENACPSHDSKT